MESELNQIPNKPASQAIGCSECAWGKVAGCWRCGSRAAAVDRAMLADKLADGYTQRAQVTALRLQVQAGVI